MRPINGTQAPLPKRVISKTDTITRNPDNKEQIYLNEEDLYSGLR